MLRRSLLVVFISLWAGSVAGVTPVIAAGPAKAAAPAASAAPTKGAEAATEACQNLLKGKAAPQFCPVDKKDELGFCFDLKQVPLTGANLLQAYAQGAFVWSVDSKARLKWYNPPKHGVVDLDRLFELNHMGHYKFRPLRKLMRQAHRRSWTISFDQSFNEVVKACADHIRPNVEHIWLTPEVQKIFTQLHQQGLAHSVEVRDATGRLIGGNYGLFHEGVYSSESMFYHESGAGKLSMYAILSHLHRMGHKIIDTQVVNFVTGPAFLAENIPLKKYLQRRREAKDLYSTTQPFAHQFQYPLELLGL